MISAEKNDFVASMKADFEKAAGMIFLDYTGLTVAEAESLRRKTRAANIGYKVVKNTLMARALAGTTAEDAAKFLKGTPTGVIIGYDDPVSAAKLTIEFLKECEHLKVKGGILDKKPIDAKQTEALSKMPSRTELIAQILGMILGTGRKVAAQIKNPAGKIVGALDAKADKQE